MNQDYPAGRLYVVTLFILTAVVRPGVFAGAQAPVDAATSDNEILAEVRKQVERLPKDKQIVVGTEMVRSALGKMKTKSMQQRLLTSLGDLYSEQGVFEESASFYRQAIDLDPSSQLATYSRMKVTTTLKRVGRDEEADKIVQELDPVQKNPRSGKTWLDDNIVSAKVNAMIDAGKIDEALAYCRDLSREFPSNRDVLLHFAERAPNSVMKKGKEEDAITLYLKIRDEFEAAKSNSTFNCNLISALRYCDPMCSEAQLERLQSAIDAFATNFPNDDNVPVFFATYADSCRNQRMNERAQAYYKKAVDHPKVSSQSRQAILRMLDDIESDNKKDKLQPFTRSGSSAGRVALVAVNIVIVTAFGLWVAYRKWSAAK